MNRRLLLAAAIVLVLAGVSVYFWRGGTERVVRRRLTSLFDVVTFDAGTSRISMALKVTSLSGYLGDEVALRTPVAELTGEFSRAQIIDIFKLLLANASEAGLRFDNLVFKEVSNDTCRIEFDIEGWMESKSGETITEAFPMESVLEKTDGEWRFLSFEMKNDTIEMRN